MKTISEFEQLAFNRRQEHGAMQTIIQNPPYSIKYDKKKAQERYDFHGAKPPQRADFLFLLDGLNQLAPDGEMAVLYPHGVLFRADGEKDIRRWIIQEGLLKAMISIPQDMFEATNIPTVLLLLNKKTAKGYVLMIDAHECCRRENKRNVFYPEHVEKILDVLYEEKEVERFSRRVPISEIEDNDYNLNFPRYIDTTVPEPPVDLDTLQKELLEIDQEIYQETKRIRDSLEDLYVTTGEQEDIRRLEVVKQIVQKSVESAEEEMTQQIEINKKVLQSIPLNPDTGFPSPSCQRVIVEIFKAYDDKEKNIKKKIEELKLLKKHMMDSMFV